MKSDDPKIIFRYLYDAGLALCLLQAAFVGITYYFELSPPEPFKGIFGIVWVTLFLDWPIWSVALVAFWFFGDRKPWRLLLPLGFGISYLMLIVFLVVHFIRGFKFNLGG